MKKWFTLIVSLFIVAGVTGCQSTSEATQATAFDVPSAQSIADNPASTPSHMNENSTDSTASEEVSQEDETIITVWCNTENKSIFEAAAEYEKGKDFRIVVEEKGTVDYKNFRN